MALYTTINWISVCVIIIIENEYLLCIEKSIINSAI